MQYGLNITGNIRVFSKEKEIVSPKKVKYKITDHWFNVSEKEDHDQWINKSINLLFPKDSALPENNTIITIESAFFVLSGSGDYRRPAIMVMSWKVADQS